MILRSDSSRYQLSSNKINATRTQVPSFDNLQAKIRDFSYSRLSNIISNQPSISRNEITHSPYKAQGMQQKITDTFGQKFGDTVNYRTKSFNSGQKWKEIIQSPTQQTPYKYLQSPTQMNYINQNSNNKETLRIDSFRTQSEHYKRNNNNNLVDVVTLNEIIALRNKIESSNVNRSQLTSTYVSELVKLAQAITTSLKSE